ncbi:hypothetical protein F4780DRAFT_374572 [Xylariomycetidae sp. FL0641]|nr:hypothetical protein F4780DRAFT_374572 [Xylariomycetidae sp. FL0641]
MGGPKVPTEEQVIWMQEHSSDTRVPDIIAACSILPVAASIFVVLRLISRRLLRGSMRLYANDWLVLVAWFLYMVFIVCLGVTTGYGAGRHIIYATDVRLLQILNLVNENLYSCVLVLLKWSVILLYRQLFASRVRWFDRLTWAVAFVATALGLQVLITTNLQCIPIATTWDPSIPGTCFDYGTSALVAYVVNFVTELTLLSMPIPLVVRLQISRQKKWMLLLMFSAGAGICIVSIVQFNYITKLGQTADATWDDIPAGLLTAVELAVGFLATSIPTYRPLYQHIFQRKIDDTENTARQNLHRNPYIPERSPDHPYDKQYGTHTCTTIVSSGQSYTLDSNYSHRDDEIVVTDQIELIRHGRLDES